MKAKVTYSLPLFPLENERAKIKYFLILVHVAAPEPEGLTKNYRKLELGIQLYARI